MRNSEDYVPPHLQIYRLARELRSSRQVWLDILGNQPTPTWELTANVDNLVIPRLSRIHIDGKPDQPLYQICRQITAGGYLLGSALDWRKPQLGNEGKTSAIRGEQWRLTVAWAGLETLIKPTIGGLQCKHLEHLSRIVLSDEKVNVLRPPSNRLLRLVEARQWPQTGSRPAMLEYIGGGSGFAGDMLKRWLYEGKPLAYAHEQLAIAQSLRHATAHGALSSTGLIAWGIRPALAPLTALVAQAAVGVYRVLIGNSTPEDFSTTAKKGDSPTNKKSTKSK
jgi:hypothetical protein